MVSEVRSAGTTLGPRRHASGGISKPAAGSSEVVSVMSVPPRSAPLEGATERIIGTAKYAMLATLCHCIPLSDTSTLDSPAASRAGTSTDASESDCTSAITITPPPKRTRMPPCAVVKLSPLSTIPRTMCCVAFPATKALGATDSTSGLG